MKTEIALNLLQVALFEKLYADLDPAALYTPGLGHGHSPAWIVGHLAITGELGQRMLGGKLRHADWLRRFGPGSQEPADTEHDLTKDELSAALRAAYEGLRDLYATAADDLLDRPHGIALFQNTPVVQVRHAVALLLTNHLGFHLGQLSSIRRQQGWPALF